ncbi:MAG TPA: alpha/beta fold hydrolase [Candidatus Aminicenantes bacterium]|nr:alpha/beta fold hydrolase [Candidatus Aminicenantes bacterium]
MNHRVVSRFAYGRFGAAIALLAGLTLPLAAKDRLPREIRRIDPLAEASMAPESVDFAALRLAAERAARQGQLLDAARIYLYIVGHNAGDGRSLYNLACCYARLEQPAAAARYLVRALKADDWDYHAVLADPDWTPVRQLAPFPQLWNTLTNAAKVRGERVWVKAGKLLPCRVRLPPGYAPERTYPLLVLLHGRGGHPDVMMETMASAGPLPAIVAAPEGAYPLDTGLERPGFSWEVASRDRQVWAQADPLTVTYLGDLLAALRRRYRCDRVFLLGHSQGGAYALLAGIQLPGVVTGVVSIGGMLPEIGDDAPVLTRDDALRGKALRVLALQGSEDPLVPTGAGEKIAATLKGLGYDATFRTYAGGHRLDDPALRQALEWMGLKP